MISFDISSLSGSGESEELLAELNETRKWMERMRFRSNASTEDGSGVGRWPASIIKLKKYEQIRRVGQLLNPLSHIDTNGQAQK